MLSPIRTAVDYRFLCDVLPHLTEKNEVEIAKVLIKRFERKHLLTCSTPDVSSSPTKPKEEKSTQVAATIRTSGQLSKDGTFVAFTSYNTKSMLPPILQEGKKWQKDSIRPPDIGDLNYCNNHFVALFRNLAKEYPNKWPSRHTICKTISAIIGADAKHYVYSSGASADLCWLKQISEGVGVAYETLLETYYLEQLRRPSIHLASFSFDEETKNLFTDMSLPNEELCCRLMLHDHDMSLARAAFFNGSLSFGNVWPFLPHHKDLLMWLCMEEKVKTVYDARIVLAHLTLIRFSDYEIRKQLKECGVHINTDDTLSLEEDLMPTLSASIFSLFNNLFPSHSSPFEPFTLDHMQEVMGNVVASSPNHYVSRIHQFVAHKHLLRLEEYQNERPMTDDAHKVAHLSSNRFGRVIDYSSHACVGSLGVKILDHTVAEVQPDGSTNLGVPRTFLFTDVHGKLKYLDAAYLAGSIPSVVNIYPCKNQYLASLLGSDIYVRAKLACLIYTGYIPALEAEIKQRNAAANGKGKVSISAKRGTNPTHLSVAQPPHDSKGEKINVSASEFLLTTHTPFSTDGEILNYASNGAHVFDTLFDVEAELRNVKKYLSAARFLCRAIENEWLLFSTNEQQEMATSLEKVWENYFRIGSGRGSKSVWRRMLLDERTDLSLIMRRYNKVESVHAESQSNDFVL
jgi:hypothetical protein